MPRLPAVLISAFLAAAIALLGLTALALVGLTHGDCGVAGDREVCIAEEVWIIRGGVAVLAVAVVAFSAFCYARLRRRKRL